MPDIHIHRAHTLGLAAARKHALAWAEQVKKDLGLNCTYAEGKTQDLLTFTRSGVNGELKVTQNEFDLTAKLGFFVGAFKGQIEAEIVKNLDGMLAGRCV
jgi:putative polyhydroxyalkanoate system protein